MIEDQLRALFADIADNEPTPSRVDAGLAHHRGRTRLRWRRAALAGAPVLAAAAVVAVVLAVGAVPFRATPSPVVTPSNVAPSSFDPLTPYASFGWLPAGERILSGTSLRSLSFQIAGPAPSPGPTSGRESWRMDAFPGGFCRLSSAAQGLSCVVGPTPAQTWRITGRAPAVAGHRAFWASSGSASPGNDYLVWQYAKGGWATLTEPDQQHPGTAWRGLAVKIAEHVRHGAHAVPPLAFPAQLTGVPAAWQLNGAVYTPDGAVSRVSQVELTTLPGVVFPANESLGGLPELRLTRAGPYPACPIVVGQARQVINGFQVFVSHGSGGRPSQWLCAPNADGLQVRISAAGAPAAIGVVSLFAHHLRLLGANPANWARKPIG